MAQPQRVAPGPAGTSCLTCKRRHKKCDLRRPICERCEKGGYECLGYSHNKQSVARPAPLGPPRRRLMLPDQDGINPPAIPQAAPWTVPWTVDSGVNGPSGSLLVSGIEDRDPSAASSGSSSVSPELCVNDQLLSTAQHRDDVDIYLDSEIMPDRRSLFVVQPPAKPASSAILSLRSLFAVYTEIPYTLHHLSKALLNSSNTEDFVKTHCDRMMEFSYFKLLQPQVAQLHDVAISRMQGSSLAPWIMFLCTKIVESFAKGDTSQNKNHHLWINQIEQAIRAALTGNLATSEIQDRLGDWLEVLLLKTLVIHSSNTYQILRNATPTFLQMVFSDPTLWQGDCDPIAVPLFNVIGSTRHELAYFAMIDATAAMAFGLPQQVEYNTSLECLPNGSFPHEWVHSSPIEFQIALAEINACRDKSPNARNWEEIEYKLTTWQARPSEYESSWESWMVVAWFAVQESWRHTLLAYLYMAVCGASSDDPRVQSAVRQILGVIGTVRKIESADANVPFFIQYLMAGICARSEKHRSTARERLTNVSETRLWLMRATDFVPVLDDLWHGAAANGRPIKWSDYVRSREKALPIVL